MGYMMIYRFAVDKMLAGLARKLLILGHDTYLRPDTDTREGFLDKALREDRIVITASRRTYRKVKETKRYKNLKLILVRTESPKKLLQGLIDLGFTFDPRLALTRCTVCNLPLKKLRTSDVFDKLPELVRQRYNEVWYCSGCGRYYWPGSHYRRMLDSVKVFLSS